jgi:hypothetical protein
MQKYLNSEFLGLPGSSSPEFRSACPTADGLGREGSKTERMARGFSPGSSQSLGSRLCRVTSVCPFSVPRQPVVAPLDGPPVKLWCRADQRSSGDHP